MNNTNNELKEIEEIYQNIRLVCEDNLYDIKSSNYKFTKKIINVSLFLVNQAIKQSKGCNAPSNLDICKIKSTLFAIYNILVKLDFFSNKEKEIDNIIENNSINLEEVYLSI